MSPQGDRRRERSSSNPIIHIDDSAVPNDTPKGQRNRLRGSKSSSNMFHRIIPGSVPALPLVPHGVSVPWVPDQTSRQNESQETPSSQPASASKYNSGSGRKKLTNALSFGNRWPGRSDMGHDIVDVQGFAIKMQGFKGPSKRKEDREVRALDHIKTRVLPKRQALDTPQDSHPDMLSEAGDDAGAGFEPLSGDEITNSLTIKCRTDGKCCPGNDIHPAGHPLNWVSEDGQHHWLVDFPSETQKAWVDDWEEKHTKEKLDALDLKLRNQRNVREASAAQAAQMEAYASNTRDDRQHSRYTTPTWPFEN